MAHAPLRISIPYGRKPVSPAEKKPSFATNSPTDAGYARSHLGLPPAHHSRPLIWDRLVPLSPSSPTSPIVRSRRYRSSLSAARRPVELRKELATKRQRAKQYERRVRFLSKLVAPPSPTATGLPATPPDSPAVFHFTLPSPGLESPLELFENLVNHPELYENMTRIEQVDFRLPSRKEVDVPSRDHSINSTSRHRPNLLPSLDQITQRLGKDISPITVSRVHTPIRGNRLPSFLRSRTGSSPSRILTSTEYLSSKGLAPESFAPPSDSPAESFSVIDLYMLPPSPSHSSLPNLVITTTICPPTRTKSSPTEFTEENISQLDLELSGSKAIKENVIDALSVARRRAQVTRNMFNTLSRRNPASHGVAACRIRAQDDTSSLLSISETERAKRRSSAPPELSTVQRGNIHPVLKIPGGF